MPYKDPEKRKASMKRWRKRVIDQGYGKWLYARRRLRFEDAERFREALNEIETLDRAGHNSEVAADMGLIARMALTASTEAEEALGPWEPTTS